MVEENYNIDSPAIIHFFRDRFIVNQSKKTGNYGMVMDMETVKGSSMTLT